jgi:FMN phosphatase YigB (HAD superfamily)
MATVRFFKFTWQKIVLILIVPFGLYFADVHLIRFNSAPAIIMALVFSYIIAYILMVLWGQFRLFFYKRAIAFDMGGVITTGDYWTEEVKLLPGSREMLKQVKRHNLLAIATNNNWMSYKLFEKHFGLDEFFDVQIVSGRIGVKKPDPRYFQIMLKELGVKAKHCVFIDDNEENVEAARSLGINGIVFSSVGETLKELKRMGFL